jgi:transposase
MDRRIVEYLRNGNSIGWICRELHVGKERVRRLREMAKAYGYVDDTGKTGPVSLPAYPEAVFPDPLDKRSLRISEPHRLLDSHRDWIEERLKAGWHKVTVFEELPVAVGRSSFYRYLDRHGMYRLGEKRSRRVVPEIVHRPGEALIIDWGKLRDVIDPETGRKKTLWMLTGIMGFSRYQMVRLVWTNDVATTLAALESMFQELGGVSFKITSDNPKCFSLKASRYEPILHPAFERFAAHYGCVIECLPPRTPQLKGKIERPMPYLRRLYEAHGDRWEGIEESQAHLNRKLAIANERKHGTTQRRPIDLFLEEESSALKELPHLAYEIETSSETKIRQDGHVRFENKYYSVDERYIGKAVICMGNSQRVAIYAGGKLIETHARLTDPSRSKSTKSHHLKPWERALEDQSVYRQRARNLGPHVERMIVALLEQGQGFIDTRKVWGILSLDKKYSHEAIDRACQQALDMGSLGYRTVKMFVQLIAAPPPGGRPDDPPRKRGGHRFTRSLEEYERQLTLLH